MPWHPRFLLLFGLLAATVAGFSAGLKGEQVELFSDAFNIDSSADWTVITGAQSPYSNPAFGDWEVAFSYDYSVEGIPSAPNSPNGETRGVKIGVNHLSGSTYSVSILPRDQHFGGDYVLKFDLWINYPGPLATGGPGSTEFAGFGIGVSAGSPPLFGNPGGEGAWFAVNGEGGNGQDFRAYKGGVQQLPASGQYGAGTATNARNTSNNYYHTTFPGGVSAPAAQLAQYSSQTGTTNVGTVGFGWREVEVRKAGQKVSWHLDGLLIATLDQTSGSGSFQAEGNIALSYLDHNVSIADSNVAYAVFDNVRVYQIPPAPIPGNITLVGHANPFSQQYGDVGGEGNVAVTGVFLSNTTHGVGIFDISDPSNPVLAADYNPNQPDATNRTRFQDVWVRDGIGYFGSWNRGGVHIVDLSNPYNPVRIAQLNPTNNGHNNVHTLFLDGDFLYQADHATNVVKVFNIANPAAPFFVRNIVTTDPDRVHQITVRNGRLFTSGWGGHTDIYDITNVGAQQPPRLGTIFSGTNSHSSWPTDDGNVLVSVREIAGGDVRFFDISDPSNPQLILLLNYEMVGIGNHIPHNPVIVGNLLFLSWYENGLQVFNISNPAMPVRVGYFETGGRGLTWDGNWGVYPLLGLDRVLLSDMSTGLFIVDATTVLTATENYPPLIVHMPESLEMAEGSDVTFSVVVTGSTPFSYQWLRNGEILDGANELELILSEIALADGGNYSVIVTNGAGEITSRSASLAVISAGEATPPQINSQPVNRTATPGQMVEFSVTVSGTPQLRYQWSFEGEEIAGAEASSLLVGPVLLTDAGAYSVRIWNAAGEIESDSAILEVDDAGFFYDLRITAGPDGAVASWKTREFATSVLEYGAPHHFDQPNQPERAVSTPFQPLHAEFDQTAPTSSRLATSHSAYLGGLQPGATYSFRVIGYTDGFRRESPEFLFKTPSDDKGGSPGLPQWWVEHYFAESMDPDIDADGDGWNLWAEYLAGTSPVDPGSRPRFSINRSGSTLGLSYWPIHPGRLYTLESTLDLKGGWALHPVTRVTTNEGEGHFLVDGLPEGNLFFRIVIELEGD